MADDSYEIQTSEQEPMVFAFGWSSQPLMTGCIVVFLILIFAAIIGTAVYSGQLGDWKSASISSVASLFPALIIGAIAWDRRRSRNSMARIELEADILAQYSLKGSVVAKGRFSDIVKMITGPSSLRATDYCYLVSFQDGQEIYFDERIDLCWKLAQIIKARTGKQFEHGEVRYRSLK